MLFSPAQVLRKEQEGTAKVVVWESCPASAETGVGVGAADRGRGRWQGQETEAGARTGTGAVVESKGRTGERLSN